MPAWLSSAASIALQFAQAQKRARVLVVAFDVLQMTRQAREPGLSHYSASKAGGEAAMAEVLGDGLTIAHSVATTDSWGRVTGIEYDMDNNGTPEETETFADIQWHGGALARTNRDASTSALP